MLPRFVRDGRGRANDGRGATGRGVFVQPFTAPSVKRLRCCSPVELRLVGWRWLGVVLEAGAVFADFDVEAGGGLTGAGDGLPRSEEHTSELQSRGHLVCRLLLEK